MINNKRMKTRGASTVATANPTVATTPRLIKQRSNKHKASRSPGVLSTLLTAKKQRRFEQQTTAAATAGSSQDGSAAVTVAAPAATQAPPPAVDATQALCALAAQVAQLQEQIGSMSRFGGSTVAQHESPAADPSLATAMHMPAALLAVPPAPTSWPLPDEPEHAARANPRPTADLNRLSVVEEKGGLAALVTGVNNETLRRGNSTGLYMMAKHMAGKVLQPLGETPESVHSGFMRGDYGPSGFHLTALAYEETGAKHRGSNWMAVDPKALKKLQASLCIMAHMFKGLQSYAESQGSTNPPQWIAPLVAALHEVAAIVGCVDQSAETLALRTIEQFVTSIFEAVANSLNDWAFDVRAWGTTHQGSADTPWVLPTTVQVDVLSIVNAAKASRAATHMFAQLPSQQNARPQRNEVANAGIGNRQRQAPTAAENPVMARCKAVGVCGRFYMDRAPCATGERCRLHHVEPGTELPAARVDPPTRLPAGQ